MIVGALALGAAVFAWRWRSADDAGLGNAVAFTGFVVVVLAASSGPLYELAEERLAVAHVIVLVLLLNLAPLLLMWALTPQLLGPWARRIAGWTTPAKLAIPIVVLTTVVYFWHVPVLFDAAAGNALLAPIQHLTLLSAGVLVWWPLAAPEPVRPPMRGLMPIAYMTADEVLVGALGVVLTWAPEPFYRTYIDAPRTWGLSAGTDQSVGGAVLTLVEELPLAVTLVVVFIRMLTREEREMQAQERAETTGPQP